jgi:hypothetical protein
MRSQLGLQSPSLNTFNMDAALPVQLLVRSRPGRQTEQENGESCLTEAVLRAVGKPWMR